MDTKPTNRRHAADVADCVSCVLPSLDGVIEEVPAADLDEIAGGAKPTGPPKSGCVSVTCDVTTIVISISKGC